MANQSTILVDPVEFLPDACMLHVLKFVGADAHSFVDPYSAEETSTTDDSTSSSESTATASEANVSSIKPPSVASAARLYSTMSLVSKTWNALLDRMILYPSFAVEVDFKHLNYEHQLPAVLWLIQHQVAIQSLVCRDLVVGYLPLLTKLLLEGNTKQLTAAKIGMFHRIVFFERNHQALTQQHAFQGILAMQCPKLEYLDLYLPANTLRQWNDYTKGGFISPLLFNSSSVQHVSVSVDLTPSLSAFDGKFFSNLIKNWNRLKSLRLQSGRAYYCRREEGPVISIASESLEKLSLESFTPCKHTIFSLDCPNLKECSFIEDRTSARPLWLDDDFMPGAKRQTVLDEDALPEGCHLRRHASPKPTSRFEWLMPDLNAMRLNLNQHLVQAMERLLNEFDREPMVLHRRVHFRRAEQAQAAAAREEPAPKHRHRHGRKAPKPQPRREPKQRRSMPRRREWRR